MQHIIELDRETEEILSEIEIHTQKSKDDILLEVIKNYLLQQAKRADLNQFLEPYKANLSGYR